MAVVRGIRNLTVHTVHPGAVATNITLNADYHNSSTQHDCPHPPTPPVRRLLPALSPYVAGEAPGCSVHSLS